MVYIQVWDRSSTYYCDWIWFCLCVYVCVFVFVLVEYYIYIYVCIVVVSKGAFSVDSFISFLFLL